LTAAAFKRTYTHNAITFCFLVTSEIPVPARQSRLLLFIEAVRSLCAYCSGGGYPTWCDIGFPYMTELFARAKSVFDLGKHRYAPLHLGDEISNLSAILLNTE